jgi:hypothetical protein
MVELFTVLDIRHIVVFSPLMTAVLWVMLVIEVENNN